MDTDTKTIIAVRRAKPLATVGRASDIRYLSPSELPSDATLIPLEVDCDAPYRLFEVSPSQSEDEALSTLGFSAGEARFSDVMMQLGRFESGERVRLLRAIALSQWSNDHRFCPTCGFALQWDANDRTKTCSNPEAPHRHFARTDPATIMLVHDGTRALLGRQASWPPGMYSTLAGFVEPGESAEAGVAREVFEETGVRVTDVAYFGSESWPFPRSLMLGYTALATTHDIVIGDEMDDVRWFTRDEVTAMQTAVRERLPHFDTIARRLLAAWVDGKSSLSG